MKLLVLAAMFASLVGCQASRLDDTPATASGETPVKFVICNPAGKDCFVEARFKDFRGCEDHKDYAGMNCDRTSPTGGMSCKRGISTLVSTYCTK